MEQIFVLILSMKLQKNQQKQKPSAIKVEII